MAQEIIQHASDIQVYINIGATLISALIGIIINSLYGRIKDLKEEIKELNTKCNKLSVDIPTDYVYKGDFKHIIDVLFSKLDKLDSKIDKVIK